MEDEDPPRPHQIRHADLELGGPDLSRILSLSDGIFAFAMTLLVLELTVPVLPTALQGAAPGVVNGWLGAALVHDVAAFEGYVLAFFLIGLWWVVHMRTFARIRRWGNRLLWLNLVFLMMIGLSPFILGILVNSGYDRTTVGVAVYAAAEGVTGALLVAMWFYATSGHRLVDPDLDPALIRYYRELGVGRVSVFGLCFILAFWNPSYALDSFFLVFVAQFLLQRRHHVVR